MKIKTDIWEKDKEYIVEKLMTIFWAIDMVLMTNVVAYFIKGSYILGTMNAIMLLFTVIIQQSYNKREQNETQRSK